MSERKLAIKMLGGFSVSYMGKELVLDRNSVSKTTQLLQIILLNTENGIAKANLIENLYGREEVENKNGSLNNTLFRLRRQLRASGLPQSSYIIIQKGICRWDADIPVEVDCRRFEETVLEGQRASETDIRMKLFMEACGLYTGEFLPDLIGEDWVTVQNIHYRNMYFSCLEELCGWLKEQEEFEKIYRLTTAASNIYPFEEWQIWRIDSLIAMTRYHEAMTIYKETTKMFFDELGLPPSQEMLKRFRFMSERITQSAGAIEDIKQGLIEREKKAGAYYCTFPSFVDIYHVISRMMERNGASVYIMICTLRSAKEPMDPENERIKTVSELLMESIRIALRKGDFYTKYNIGQYLVMLPGIKRENCNIVSSRIDHTFRGLVKRNEFQIDFYADTVAEISSEMRDQKFGFLNTKNIWSE